MRRLRKRRRLRKLMIRRAQRRKPLRIRPRKWMMI